ncbi:MAG: N-acetylmuramoyl-L-alanine amidase [Cyclobacteriaceae bacterium]
MTTLALILSLLRKFAFSLIGVQLFCLLLSPVSSAQNYKMLNTRQSGKDTPYLSRQTTTVAPNEFYTFENDFGFTSVAVGSSPSADFRGAYLIVGQDTIFLQEDIHQSEEDSLKYAVLLVFEETRYSFRFYTGPLSGPISISLLNARQGQTEARRQAAWFSKSLSEMSDEICEQPALIPQSVWRTGLPAPSYTRTETEVRHVIVHHSAGSNTSTDHLNTVRNIYLFHTQDRGWSDIGYNFLVARDGTIFQGRSFGDENTDSGSIRGAHFCGQNSNTMGICMLGNFNTALPTDTALTSLQRLTAWKLQQEDLDPLESFTHPANANLGVIAGHRNGCATECPGSNLYARLDEVRLSVAAYLEDDCGDGEEIPIALRVFPVPLAGEGSLRLAEGQILHELRLIDMRGKQWPLTAYRQDELWKFDASGLAAGMYILRIIGPDFQHERKLLIY